MNALKLLSRSEMRMIKGGDPGSDPEHDDGEWRGIECVDSTGSVTKSTCYTYGCAYAGDWCGDDTCNDITDC